MLTEATHLTEFEYYFGMCDGVCDYLLFIYLFIYLFICTTQYKIHISKCHVLDSKVTKWHF